MADLSPMMKQYFQIKEQNPDFLLFFRKGDFYELFFEMKREFALQIFLQANCMRQP